MKRIASVLLVALSSCVLSAQQPFDVNQRLGPEQLIADVDFYLKTLEEVHIDPYARISARELRARAEEIKAQVRRRGPLTQKEFWLLFTPLVSAIQDSHSYVVDPRFFVKPEQDPTKYFPFFTVYIDGRVVVTQSFADEKVGRGAIITSVNGVKSDELVRKISGHRSGVERERAESAVLWLWVGAAELFGRPDEFNVSLSDGRELRVRGLRLPEVVERQTAARAAGSTPAPEGSPLELKLLEGGVAYLNAKTFSYDLEKYKELLGDAFTRIKSAGAKALIVDVRANSGGNSALGDALLDMFNSKPYRHYSVKWKRSEQYVEELKRKNRPVPDGYLALRPGEILSGESRAVKPGDNPLRFRGRVYVLSARETFSSGQMFLAIVKDNKLATVVGEETTAPVCNFGEILFFNLPHSRLRTSLSTKAFAPPAGCKDARGVVPDKSVGRRVEDYLTGKDPVLETTLDLIRRGGA